MTDEDARKYAGDASSFMEISHIFNDPENKVKKYRATLSLADEFVASLNLATCVKHDMGTILEAAMTKEYGKAASQLLGELGDQLTPAQKLMLDKAVEQLTLEQIQLSRKRDAVDSSTGTPDSHEIPSPSKKQKHVYSGMDLEGRDSFSKMTLETNAPLFRESPSW
mmetsp:Transcript_9885/g.16420  ORF Transcript_9885/g.16420 Transcript_9885/m.16420 type:complete len:166 (+) Transcript_9885:881-1378(+)